VEVADVGLDVGDLLAAEHRLEVEHAVSCGVVWADVDEHRVRLRVRAGVFLRLGLGLALGLAERVDVLLQRDHLRLVLIVVAGQRMALPRLGQQDAPEVRVALVRDADEVVRLAFVPLRGLVHRRGALRPRVVAARGNDHADLLGRIVVLLEVVDALVAVLVLLCGQQREVVEPGLALERSEDLLHVVGPYHEPLGVEMDFAPDNAVAQQVLQRVVVDDAALLGGLDAGVALRSVAHRLSPTFPADGHQPWSVSFLRGLPIPIVVRMGVERQKG